MDTNIVEVYINYLRKKLGRNAAVSRSSGGGRRSVIRTVRGKGYLLEPPEGSDVKADAGDSPTDRTAIFAMGRYAADA